MWSLIITYVLLCLGILLCFFGKIPGQVLAYAGMLVSHFWMDIEYPVWLLVVCGVLVVVSIVINFVLVPKLAQKVHEFGKPGKIGTIVGSLLSIAVLSATSSKPVLGLVFFFILPYLLAFVFETISKKNAGEGAKRALGAYTLFAVSTLINLAISVFCLMEVICGGKFFQQMVKAKDMMETQAIIEAAKTAEDVANSAAYAMESASECDVEEIPASEGDSRENLSPEQEAEVKVMLDRFQNMAEKLIRKQMDEDILDLGLYNESLELANSIRELIGDYSSEQEGRFNAIEYALSCSATFGPTDHSLDFLTMEDAIDDLVEDIVGDENDFDIYSDDAKFNDFEDNFDIVATRLLTESDIENMTKDDLRILRNAIYARHGYIFKSNDLKEYFSMFDWYEPTTTDANSLLSDVEKKNIAFIQAHEK